MALQQETQKVEGNLKNKIVEKQEKGFKIIRNSALFIFFIALLFYFMFSLKPDWNRLFWDLEMMMQDMKTNMIPRRKASDSIAVATIDELSLKKFGRWPWDRSVVAECIDILMKKGAKGIVFDVAFAEKIKMNLDERLIKIAAENGIELDSGDKKMAEVLEQYGKSVVLGAIIIAGDREHEVDPITPEMFEQIKMKQTLFTKKIGEGEDHYPLTKGGYSIILPEKRFLETTAGIALFGMRTKIDLTIDGVIRQYPVIDGIASEDKWFVLPNLALAAAERFFGTPPKILYNSDQGIISVQIGDNYLPVDADALLEISYFGDQDAFYSFSLSNAEKADVKDKIVFVGSTAMGAAYDVRSTPVNQFLPGVYVHATVLDNIISRSYLRVSWFSHIFPFLFLLLPLLFIKRLYNTILLWQAILFMIVLSSVMFFLSYLLHLNGYITYIATTMITLWIMFIVVYVGKYFFVDKERGQVKTAFSRYLDPRLLNRVVNDASGLKLYGERKEIVILFSDIKGFTTISERMDAEELVKTINRLFNPTTEAIFEHMGFLDKYMGDAMMALFGVPVDIEDKEKQSCRAAVKIIERINKVRKELEAEGLPDITMGVGINAGVAAVGNMGSEHRFDYSAIGDSVNTASRFEGLTRVYGVNIVVSESVYEKAKEEFVIRRLDCVQVKGKKHGVNIYELCYPPAEKEKHLRLKEEYETALDAFTHNQMDQVISLFEKTTFKEDPAFIFLHKRAVEMKASGAEYNGIWAFTSK